MGAFARFVLISTALGGAAVYLLAPRFRAHSPKHLSYSQFVRAVESGEVPRVTLTRNAATGTLASGERFRCNVPRDDAHLHAALQKAGVDYDIRTPFLSGTVGSLLMYLLFPLAMFFLLWMFIMRQAQQTTERLDEFPPDRAVRSLELKHEAALAAALEAARAEQTGASRPVSPYLVSLNDIGGLDDAKEQLREIVEFLKEPERFQALGAKIPKGVLLTGPPGCGKTLLMRALTNEVDVSHLHVNGSDFDGRQIGLGASRVRRLFVNARGKRPCLLFIDHLDAIGADRRAPAKPDDPVPNQTVYELAAQMDGFEPNAGIIVIAATHRLGLVDPVLLRSGRFDRLIRVDEPDAAERQAILELHVRGKPMVDDIDMAALADQMDGLTGADIANIVNEAALAAALAGSSTITMVNLEEAVRALRSARQAAPDAKGDSE